MMMKISNPAVGEIEFEESSVIVFKEGMLGLPNFKRYLLLESDNIRPFFRLQSVDEPSISFLLIDPSFADESLKNYVAERDPEQTYLERIDECDLLVVCNVSDDGSDVTANLVAPVIINNDKRVGYQLVLLDSPYDVRHSLIQASEGKEA